MTVDFIGIGVQKAATSWLHDMLAAHPDIATSEPKELDYFTAHYNRGAYWYEAQFPGDAAGRIRGECSPSYFNSWSAPSRAHAYNPDFRLVCILRDPVARAFSNHLHEIRKGHIPESLSFDSALALNPSYVDQGRYRANLDRWLAVFPRAQLLVLLAEEIAAQPETAFSEVCRHVGADPAFRPEGLGERRHESVGVRAAGPQRALRAAGDAARRAGFGGLVRGVKAAPGARHLLALNRRDLRAEVAPIPETTAQRLAEGFAGDMRFVATLMGRATLPWPSWERAGLAAPPDAPRTAEGAVHGG